MVSTGATTAPKLVVSYGLLRHGVSVPESPSLARQRVVTSQYFSTNPNEHENRLFFRYSSKCFSEVVTAKDSERRSFSFAYHAIALRINIDAL